MQSENQEWPGRWCDLVGDFLCALDAGGCVTRVNAVWEEGLGVASLGPGTANFLALTHPDDRAGVGKALADRAASFESRLVRVSGGCRRVHWKTASSGQELFLIGRDVTEQDDITQELDAAQQNLSDAYQKLTFYMMNSPLAFVEWDRALRVRYWSPEAERAFGWSADDVLDRHPEEWAFLDDGDSAEFLSVLADLVNDIGGRTMALSRHVRPDGSSVLSEWYHAALRDADGQVLSVFSLALDVTERMRTEADLLKIRKAFESASDAICIADGVGSVIHLNRAFTDLLGYSLGQINPHGIDALLADAVLTEEITAVVAGGHSWKGEAELVGQDGSLVPVTLRADAIRDEGGRPIGRITVCTDLRERKKAEKDLIHQALHDSLTGLPNRSFFSQRLDRVFTRGQRADAVIACLFIDLDNFKVINDSLGHAAGDDLLRTVAERLKDSVRPEDMVARLGGDEFVILLEDMADPEQTAAIARRVSDQLKRPVSLAGRELFVTASIGIAAGHSGHGGPKDLLRDADVAMYQAKTGGKAGFVFFDPRMNAEAMDRLELEMDLRRAIERGELEVYYQPIVHLESSRVTEVEALLRWQHPQRGFIGPAKFIPIAEETGLIGPLGEWVLERACACGQDWQDRYPSDQPITISVNLSTRQLQQEDLVDRVRAVLEKTGLPPGRLKLEITESVMMLDSEAVLGKLHALKALGIRLAVDDFGTGYSSMAYLSSLPVDTLKIDRAFISRLGQTAEDDAIVRAILTMAKTMGLFVTAEGIESVDQLGELRALGCDRGQGYLFAKPLTISDFEQLLDRIQPRTFTQDAKEPWERRAA